VSEHLCYKCQKVWGNEIDDLKEETVWKDNMDDGERLDRSVEPNELKVSIALLSLCEVLGYLCITQGRCYNAWIWNFL